MSSLTIEMGIARRRNEPPPMPDQLAGRSDMTLAQKQRLAVLAKMGVGPIAEGPPAQNQHSLMNGDMPPLPGGGLPVRDRRMELLEKERKIREAEEAAEEEREKAEQEKRQKRSRITIGMPRLGMVMPREDNIPQVPPTPAQLPEPKQWTLKISKDTAERAAKSSAADSGASTAATFNEPTDPEEERKEREREMQVMMQIHKERARRAAQAKAEREKAEPKAKPKASKKKKRRRNKEDNEDWEEWQGEVESGDEESDHEPAPPPHLAREQRPKMVVESVKGKVSNANKNLTDADLERRFATAHDGPGGSLMTEAEVLSIIRREKQERGGPIERGGASASRRVQRELDEWADKKAQQRARVKSPHRFERMVIARK